MSGRVVKEVAYGARRVSIMLAEEVKDKGFKRSIHAIDPALITQTADKVANAFNGSTMMTASQKAQADKIVITYDLNSGRNLKSTVLNKRQLHASSQSGGPRGPLHCLRKGF